MDGRLGCDNPRVDVNLPIHRETVLFSFGGAEESYRVCNPHIGFIRYHRIAMINAVLTIFSSCTIAISAYTKELEFRHITKTVFLYINKIETTYKEVRSASNGDYGVYELTDNRLWC